MKHTPAPWEVIPSAFNNSVRQTGDLEPLATCHVNTNMHGRKHAGIAELQANARLIAAAPELLEALEQAMLEDEYILPSTVEVMQAAIKKAKGE